MSKQFTAMAIMLLVHDRKLQYEDRLTDIFPDFPEYGRAITIRHLLTHTSGLPDYPVLIASCDNGLCTILSTGQFFGEIALVTGSPRTATVVARKSCQLLVLDIAASEVVIGSALLTLFISGNVPLGVLTIVLAQVMFSIPFVAITVRARLAGFDPSLEEAAQDLGASPISTFLLVTLPVIFPGVVAAALLAFALCVDDYVITSFVSGNTLTFPLWVYGATREGVPPQVNVIGTFIFVGGGLLAITGGLVRSWRSRQLARESTS